MAFPAAWWLPSRCGPVRGGRQGEARAGPALGSSQEAWGQCIAGVCVGKTLFTDMNLLDDCG